MPEYTPLDAEVCALENETIIESPKIWKPTNNAPLYTVPRTLLPLGFLALGLRKDKEILGHKDIVMQ